MKIIGEEFFVIVKIIFIYYNFELEVVVFMFGGKF